jgi:surfeit locus 1 family protein
MKKNFPHIFVFFAFLFLVYLGTWQVQRLLWKTALIEKVNARTNGEPISIPEYKNVADDEFRLLKLIGEFDYKNEITLLSRTYNGKAGVHVLTPLHEENLQKTILIDRGWVKSDGDYEKPVGRQEIIGIIRAGQKQNWIMLDNDPAKNFWFWVDLPAMYKKISAPQQDFYLDLKQGAAVKTYPIALPKKIEIYNEHLQYAITWYSLSLALLGVYYCRFWHKKRK